MTRARPIGAARSKPHRRIDVGVSVQACRCECSWNQGVGTIDVGGTGTGVVGSTDGIELGGTVGVGRVADVGNGPGGALGVAVVVELGAGEVGCPTELVLADPPDGLAPRVELSGVGVPAWFVVAVLLGPVICMDR